MERIEYTIVGNKVVIKDDNGMKDPIPFVNNFLDREILETVIKYVQERLDNDNVDLENKVNERNWRLADYKKHTLFSVGAAVVIPPVTGAAFGLYQQQVDTIFGQTNALVSFSASMIPAILITSQILFSYGLKLRPSKSDIRGKEEVVKIEKELLEGFTTELAELKKDNSKDELKTYKKEKSGYVSIDGVMKFVRDTIRLRYVFGSQHKKIMQLYSEGLLKDYMIEYGMDIQAVEDFIEYIDSYVYDANFDKESSKGI